MEEKKIEEKKIEEIVCCACGSVLEHGEWCPICDQDYDDYDTYLPNFSIKF